MVENDNNNESSSYFICFNLNELIWHDIKFKSKNNFFKKIYNLNWTINIYVVDNYFIKIKINILNSNYY